MSNSSSQVKISQQASVPQFAYLLNSYIKRRCIDYTELADYVEVQHETVLRWLTGKVSRPRQQQSIIRCADCLNLTTEERTELLLAAGFSSQRVTHAMPSPPNLSLSFASMYSSPFVIGPPITEPRQFFGREYLLKRIFDLWKCMPLQHIAVVGSKRSGKTSLLHYIRRIIDTPNDQLRPNQRNNWMIPGYQWVFIDFQDPRMCYQESLLRYILNELDLPVPEPCDLINFMEITDQYLEIPTLILLDEVSVGLAAHELDEQFWWGMRSLGSNHAGGKIGFLMTAHEPPEKLAYAQGNPSPFFNIFGHVFNLGALTMNEALDLIHSSPIPFADNDVEWILEQSALWPALLQILCHSRLVALEENIQGEAWKNEAMRRMKPYLYLLHPMREE